jgi:hypothetical protein
MKQLCDCRAKGDSSDVTPAISYCSVYQNPGFHGILREIPGFSVNPRAILGRLEIQDPEPHAGSSSSLLVIGAA